MNVMFLVTSWFFSLLWKECESHCAPVFSFLDERIRKKPRSPMCVRAIGQVQNNEWVLDEVRSGFSRFHWPAERASPNHLWAHQWSKDKETGVIKSFNTFSPKVWLKILDHWSTALIWCWHKPISTTPIIWCNSWNLQAYFTMTFACSCSPTVIVFPLESTKIKAYHSVAGVLLIHFLKTWRKNLKGTKPFM